MQVYVVNTHPANNAIKRWVLVIRNDQKREWLGHPVPTNLLTLGGRANGLVDMDTCKDRVLQKGWSSQGWIRFNVGNATLGDIVGKNFKLIAIDVYNANHEVKGIVPSRYTFDFILIAPVAT